MSTSPVISVLMPALNAEKYLTEAVQSVLLQSFTDFEFLICDDGSTDATARLLRNFAERDPRINYYSRPNRGFIFTLNELAAAARGEFFARMDADDASTPQRLENQLRFLENNPAVAAVSCGYTLMDERGRIQHRLCAVRRTKDEARAHPHGHRDI